MMINGRHKNRYAWKPNAGVKINETEVGGRFRPLSEITGVCQRCKEQIEWKRKYGKYKPLTEPTKCQRCTKRAVRQSHHKLCQPCAKEHGVCAKCCCRNERIVGKDPAEVEAEQKELQEAIKNARERDRRTLLRAMNAGKSMKAATEKEEKGDKAGDSALSASLEEHAEATRDDEGDSDGDDDDEEEEEEDEKTYVQLLVLSVAFGTKRELTIFNHMKILKNLTAFSKSDFVMFGLNNFVQVLMHSEMLLCVYLSIEFNMSFYCEAALVLVS